MKKTFFLLSTLLLFRTVSQPTEADAKPDRQVTPVEYTRLTIDLSSPEYLSPYVFGHNLEHTRAAINGGLSAQMLRNRKFAGKPAHNMGLSAHWFGIGDKTLYYLGGRKPYTQHTCMEAMKRNNECQSQTIQNMTEGHTVGMGQNGLALQAGAKYILRTVTKVSAPLTLKIELIGKGKTYDSKELKLSSTEDWVVTEFEMTSSVSDEDASITYTFTEQAEITFGSLSMMPADNFHGMRKDVVAKLKEIGPAILRWPGGNFAGEYRWKDGLLPVDRRGPLQAATEIETQPYTDGYDYHEIDTDDFIDLCREVGAEPFMTINPVWSTPEESAQWVEYCNGQADSEYGRLRVERGHKYPYNVKFWSLGNEMGYRHMEGPSGPSGYADMASKHAEAMLAKTPDLKLFSSGPYPNDNWAVNSAAVLADKAPYVSLHHYSRPSKNFLYTTEDDIRETYRQIVMSVEPNFTKARKMRESLDRTGVHMHISFDEWNQWYSWYRPSCVTEGIFTAKFLHGIIGCSTSLDIPVCCYFQPVGEGAILITPTSSRLTANGQVFSIMKAHKGGRLCHVSGAKTYQAAATVKDGILTLTLVNDSYDQPENIEISVKGKVLKSKLLSSDDARPYTYFNESALNVTNGRNSIKLRLPAHSVASIEVVL